MDSPSLLPKSTVGDEPAQFLHKSTAVERFHTSDEVNATKQILQDFLNTLGFQPPRSPRNFKMREQLASEVALWDLDGSVRKALSIGCDLAETTYSHTSYEEQCYIALYTTFFLWTDDDCARNPEPYGEFARRFWGHIPQIHPVLEQYAALLHRAFTLWPLTAATGIVIDSLSMLSSMYIEKTTEHMVVRPGAIRYPPYLRRSTAGGCGFGFLAFPSSWRPNVDSYIQIIPEMDFYLSVGNDVLSFYKEFMDGETDNYIHLRATAEGRTPTEMLRIVADEVIDTLQRTDAITSTDFELNVVWKRFFNGFLEFHMRAPRYRLAELGFSAE